MPASGPVTHCQWPSFVSPVVWSLASEDPIQEFELTFAFIKAFSPALVIVTRYPVNPLYVEAAAKAFACLHVLVADTTS